MKLLNIAPKAIEAVSTENWSVTNTEKLNTDKKYKTTNTESFFTRNVTNSDQYSPVISIRDSWNNKLYIFVHFFS